MLSPVLYVHIGMYCIKATDYAVHVNFEHPRSYALFIVMVVSHYNKVAICIGLAELPFL